jgi:hypothetical protein
MYPQATIIWWLPGIETQVHGENHRATVATIVTQASMVRLAQTTAGIQVQLAQVHGTMSGLATAVECKVQAMLYSKRSCLYHSNNLAGAYTRGTDNPPASSSSGLSRILWCYAAG